MAPPSLVRASQLVDGLFPPPGLRESSRVYKKPLETAWAAFLAPYDWHWFATFTFKDSTHPEAAAKRFAYWVRKLDEANGYRRKAKSTHCRRSTWVRGLEYQKRAVVHFHCLIGNLPVPCHGREAGRVWARYWFEMGLTGIARIVPVASVGRVVEYITKYSAKGGEVDVSPNLLRIGDQFAGF